jgi:hypothetical protein
MQVSRKQGYIAHVTGHHFKEIVENISQKYFSEIFLKNITRGQISQFYSMSSLMMLA